LSPVADCDPLLRKNQVPDKRHTEERIAIRNDSPGFRTGQLAGQERLAMYSDAQVLREAEEGEDAELPSDWPGPSRQQPGANSGGISYQVY
jgi:hypothetical protein